MRKRVTVEQPRSGIVVNRTEGISRPEGVGEQPRDTEPHASRHSTRFLGTQSQWATAQRTGEVVNAEWCKFDLEDVWTIPGKTAKNGMPRAPLSPPARAILEAIPEPRSSPRNGD
ncbi:MAG TPA: hypothetical protein VJ770_12205 [Stellaceae bacterium]|nr:hypothetical protein [Stellaceae bacterium]